MKFLNFSSPSRQVRGQETIFYRGRRILVEVVQTIQPPRGNAEDTLLVDAKGRYYYRRQRWKANGNRLPQRVLLHRLSLAGAILCELRLDSTTGHSRLRDATSMLLRNAANAYALDSYARQLVRWELRDHPGRDARDLVNAGIYFLLGDPGLDSGQCKEKARQRRLADREAA